MIGEYYTERRRASDLRILGRLFLLIVLVWAIWANRSSTAVGADAVAAAASIGRFAASSARFAASSANAACRFSSNCKTSSFALASIA